MGDDILIEAGRDVAFGKNQAIAQIRKTKANGTKNTYTTLEEELNKLALAVQEIAKDMPANKAEEVRCDLQALSDEAQKDQPRKKWYELSAEALIEAAKTVGTLGKPVIESVQSILKLIT